MGRVPSIVYWLEDRLYLNITNRCSNDCYFCLRRFKDGISGFNLTLQHDPSFIEITDALQGAMNRRSWREVVFCGFGEPLERLDCIVEVSKWVKRYFGLRIRVDTNGHGYLLNKGRDVAEELKAAGVDAVSVSLNAHDKKTYNKVCRPKFPDAFENVLDFVDRAKTRFYTEITAVDVPEVNIQKLEEMAIRTGVNFRVRKYLSPVS